MTTANRPEYELGHSGFGDEIFPFGRIDSVPVLILLPASEGKTPATSGAAVDWEGLSFPELTAARRQAAHGLQEISAHPDGLAELGLGASLGEQLEHNLRVHTAAAAPAHKVYSGVLYDALDYPGMTAAQRKKAQEAIIVFSGLWGAVSFADSIPAYRLPISAGLPGTGRLAGYWREQLTASLNARAEGELIIDCRSSGYAAMWVAPAERSVEVKVFQLRNGKRSVVSHFAKHTRGELARHLLTRRGKTPGSPEALLKAAQERWEAELSPAKGKNAHTLSLILPEGVSFAKKG